MNEVLAYGIGAAALFGVVAPNSGNQSILVKYGTEEQKQKWLMPLIDGEMESGFSMTEPANAGSDPRSLTTSAVLDGDHWVINGHKWFTSHGIDAEDRKSPRLKSSHLCPSRIQSPACKTQTSYTDTTCS